MFRRPTIALLIALGLYVVFRGLVLYTAFDAVCLPDYELYMGNIGKIVADGGYGPPLPQYYDNCGGHLVTGLMSIPLFGAIGQSYLALKLVPVGLGLLSMLMIWAILKRHFDARAAAVAVLLFSIGPPTLAKYSMLAKGNHFENLFFQLLAMWCFYRLHTSRDKRKWLMLFGACSGFAIFFYFGSMAMLALMAFMHLCIRGPKRAVLDLRCALPGVAIGLIPLAWVHWNSNLRPAGFLNAKLGGSNRPGLDTAMNRMSELVTDFLPRGGVFKDLGPISGSIAEWTLLIAWIVSFAILIPRVMRGLARCLRPHGQDENERASEEAERFQALRAAPLLAFLPAFILLYGFSTFEFKYYGPPVEVGQFRYLVPHFMFSCLLIGIAVSQLWMSDRSGVRKAGWLLAVASISTQAFSLPIIDFSAKNVGLGTKYDGFEFAFQNNVLQRDMVLNEVTGRRTWDMNRVRDQLLEFPLPERVRSAIGVGNYTAYEQSMPPIKRATEPQAARVDLALVLSYFPNELHLDIARGVGSFLRGSPSAQGEAKRRLTHWLPILIQDNHPQLAHVIYGLCEDPNFPLARKTRSALSHNRWIGPHIPAALHWAFWRGQGVACGQFLTRGIASDIRAVDAFLSSAKPGAAEDLWFGLGFGAAEKSRDLTLPAAFAERLAQKQLSTESRTAALAGYGAGIRHSQPEKRRAAIFAALRKELDAADAGRVEIGLRWPDYPLPLKL